MGNDIADALRVERRTRESQARMTSGDYLLFIGQVRTILLAHRLVLSDLAEQTGRPVLKVVDDFLWWATHRPLFLLGGQRGVA